jgi:hypothetical protein
MASPAPAGRRVASLPPKLPFVLALAQHETLQVCSPFELCLLTHLIHEHVFVHKPVPILGLPN